MHLSLIIKSNPYQRTCTNMRETSSVGEPSRQAATPSRMPCFISCGGQCDKHPGGGDVFNKEAVQLSEHLEERHTTTQVRSRFGVDAVRYQRGTDAVAGNITDEQAEVVLVQRIYHGEVAADGMHGMIEGVDAHGAPDQGSRCETVLDSSGEA